MLQQLDDGWAKGDPAALRAAIDTMISLDGNARNLLSKQIPRNDGPGVFGPQFRKVKKA